MSHCEMVVADVDPRGLLAGQSRTEAALAWLRRLHRVCRFSSRERTGEASGSELKRWCQQGAVIVNGGKVAWDENLGFPVKSLVLFPKGNRVTVL
jgi:hypothetical protein